jgi:dienelactone hydrolase
MDANTPSAHDAKIVGLVAYYPYCYDKVEFSTPTLVLIGDKDDWIPAKLCEAVKGKPNLEMVVFPGPRLQRAFREADGLPRTSLRA